LEKVTNSNVLTFRVHIYGVRASRARGSIKPCFKAPGLAPWSSRGLHSPQAEFQGADLTQAQLQGADLTQAQLQGAGLTLAQLQGAKLDSAQLQGASLGCVQLQGASLDCTQLQGASLDHVFVWRTKAPRDVDAERARINELQQTSETHGDFADLKQKVETVVPRDYRERAPARISLLDPDKKSEWQPGAWTHLEQSSPQPKDYENTLRAVFQRVGCASVGAPYVIHGLVMSRFNQRFTADPAQAASVATTFLTEETCPGARGLSESDKAKLHDFSGSAAPQEP
jgi:hypothetical protein